VESEARMRGLLIAFEGLDQSGKQTQAELLKDRLVAAGRRIRLQSFPAYDTPIGAEIERALSGTREWGHDVLQLLYIANRYELKPAMERDLASGTIILCDRYVASSIAYGETQGLDASWLSDVQRHLPQPNLTCLLDIRPEVSVRRKQAGRDRFERDLALLARVRESYVRQATSDRWVSVDADRDRPAVAADVFEAVRRIL
jgi:dTMP kinase